VVDHAEQVHKVMEQSRFEKTLDNYYFGSSDIGCIDRAWSYADQNLSAIGVSPYGMEVGLTGNPQQGNCRTTSFPGGLRGAIIAWSDGIFNSLGVTYFGPSGI
jgi:hypothetical protein